MKYSTCLPVFMFVVLDNFVSGKLRHHMTYYDVEDYADHPCKRPCKDGAAPMTCDFDFLVEHYHTLTKACYDCPHNHTSCFLPHCIAADGGQRGLIVVNRMMPGPSIHVCEGDKVRVRVHNKMSMSEGTTIHWHGQHQHGTPHMDGVAMVTQCPIPSHTSFTYAFHADTPGTQYWHAHSGMQRSEGVFGVFIVRQPPKLERHVGNYDYDLPEHAVVINDWLARETAAGFAQHHLSDGTNKPRSMLINGKGVYSYVVDPVTGKNSSTPREEFLLEPGKRYRFRVISNGILNCPLRVSVDRHMLDIIATDGFPVEPFEVESFDIFAGERYDFVLTTNQSVGNYLLRVQGLADCGIEHKNARQTAILRYKGAQRDVDYITPAPELLGKRLNPFNTKESNTRIQVTNLTSLMPQDEDLSREPDKRFTLTMDFNWINNPRFHNKDHYPLEVIEPRNKRLLTPQMNHISMMFPPAPPLTQLGSIPKSMFCNNDTMTQDCTSEFCECIHLLKVDLGDVVELLLVDEGHPWNANHPMHLHGHAFRVVAMDKLNTSTYTSDVIELDRRGEITRNLNHSPLKDTVTVPDGGYTILRFHANNPGMWLFHCHIEYHVEIGMGLLFQVGEEYEFAPIPQNFPTCGNWDEEEEIEEHDDFDAGNNGVTALHTSLTSHCSFVVTLLILLQTFRRLS